MRTYCTYFDHHYLPRGLALYESLRRHDPACRLWVLCLSPECRAWLVRQRLPGLEPIGLEELERADPALLQAKPTRSVVEYYFTCTPSLPKLVLDRDSRADLVTYLDADLYFFRDPEPVFAEIGSGSIAIIPHRFPTALKHLENTGVYNVGWVSFRRDERAAACLAWWREQCLAWCYDRAEPGRYGDQKYLDVWPDRFPGTVVLRQKGANLAPWNLANYRLRWRNQRVWVDDDELVFFHFHGFRRVNGWLYEPNVRQFHARVTRVAHRRLFVPYWHALCAAQAAVGGGAISHGIRETPPAAEGDGRSLVGRAWAAARRGWRLAEGVAKGKFVPVWRSEG